MNAIGHGRLDSFVENSINRRRGVQRFPEGMILINSMEAVTFHSHALLSVNLSLSDNGCETAVTVNLQRHSSGLGGPSSSPLVGVTISEATVCAPSYRIPRAPS